MKEERKTGQGGGKEKMSSCCGLADARQRNITIFYTSLSLISISHNDVMSHRETEQEKVSNRRQRDGGEEKDKREVCGREREYRRSSLTLSCQTV